jgi:hypothetical protein
MDAKRARKHFKAFAGRLPADADGVSFAGGTGSTTGRFCVVFRSFLGWNGPKGPVLRQKIAIFWGFRLLNGTGVFLSMVLILF